MTDLEQLRLRVREFAEVREWDQYHTPKNLAMALIVEAAELVEHFQWMTEAQTQQLNAEKLAQVGEELADIQIYLIRIADKLSIDLVDAAHKKIAVNAIKYPVDKARGNSKKYDEL